MDFPESNRLRSAAILDREAAFWHMSGHGVTIVVLFSLVQEMERRNRKVKIASIGIKKIDSDQFGICLVSSHQMRAKAYIISTAPGKTEIARLSIPRCAIPSSRAPP